MADQLDEACEGLGRPLRAGAAAQFLEEDVRAVAERLRITEAYALRRYFDTWAQEKAQTIAELLDTHAVETAAAPTALVTTPTVVRLIAGLGQATLFAGQNLHPGADDEQSWVITQGGDTITALALALIEQPARDAVIVPGSVITATAKVLDRFADILESGTWAGCRCASPLHEHPSEARVAEQVRADRALLGPREI